MALTSITSAGGSDSSVAVQGVKVEVIWDMEVLNPVMI